MPSNEELTHYISVAVSTLDAIVEESMCQPNEYGQYTGEEKLALVKLYAEAFSSEIKGKMSNG
jgi:hypothetical protein